VVLLSPFKKILIGALRLNNACMDIAITAVGRIGGIF
jgi:hypothetical protein